MRLLKIVFAALILISLSFFLGKNITKIQNKLVELVDDLRGINKEVVYPSIFVNLKSKEFSIPVIRDGNGGGITSINQNLILLTHEGKFFLLDSNDKLEQLTISPPENGFGEYGKLSQNEKYKNYNFKLSAFRYNDVSYYSLNNESGLIVSYTKYHPEDNCYVNAIDKLELFSKKQEKALRSVHVSSTDWVSVYRSKPCLPLKDMYGAIEGHMAGGRITFQSPSTIWLASSDYHWDGVYAPKSIAQDNNYEYGKVIKIDLFDNSYQVFASGLRNMQGIVVDNNQNVFTVEHGVRGGDELNLIKEGVDYGWPKETLGTLYSKSPFPNVLSYGRHDNFERPFYSWLPSIAASNVTLIDEFHDSWNDDLLIASLAGKSLYRVRIKDSRVIFSEQIKIGKRIRYVHQHRDGRLALWTDDKKLIMLSALEHKDINGFIVEYLSSIDVSESLQVKVKRTIDQCLECHSFSLEDNIKAPSLNGMYDSQIGSTKYQYYSDALKNKKGKWTGKNLKSFITSPQDFAPGSNMPDPNINDLRVLNLITEVIQKYEE